ncbi:MAG: Ig-like domain-containing protein, partial [Propionibacteriaceae bacterium]|nr:Ig-like domain-containing protein [Propionibacteriaceae bacterium]
MVSRSGKRWAKPVTVLTSFTLMVGGLFLGNTLLAAPASAAAKQGVITDTGGWHSAQPVGAALTAPMTPIDSGTLYGVSYNDYGTILTFARDGAAPNKAGQQLIAHGNAALAGMESNPLSTIAVDADPYGTRGQKYAYLWGWDFINYITPAQRTALGITANPANYSPVFRFAPGATVPDILMVPNSAALGRTTAGGYNYWSGGEVIQKTGEIFFSDGECSTLQGMYSMMILNPTTGAYNFSDRIQPLTTSDAIFGESTGPGCGLQGYVSSDFALDALGDAYIQVVSTSAAPAFGLGAASRVWLVKVVPGENGAPWTYNLVTPIQAGPSQGGGAATYAAGGTYNYGSAFYQGMLYVTEYQAGGQLIQVNPMSGYAYNMSGAAMGTVQTYMQDLATGQTARVVQGHVYNDANASGTIDSSEAGLSGQTVALYLKNASGTFVYQGQRTTDGSGNYSFLVAGNGDYIVRLVQPQIDGVNALQTYALAGGKLNPVVAKCANGDVTAAGVCEGALVQPAPDPALPTGLAAAGTDTATQPGAMAMYSTIAITTDQEVANADFGVTTAGSYGDAHAGPATGSTVPVHLNGPAPKVQLGATMGVYAGPAADNAAHNGTDDGLYFDSYAGPVPLAGTVLAATEAYTLVGDVTGSQASSAKVTGWATGAGNDTWAAAPAWQPTVSGGKATGTFQFQTAGVMSGAPVVQFRADASTVPQAGPTNTGDYWSATGWTTPGEIEDYAFTVADAVYRPAARTTGGTGTFTVGGAPLTADNTTLTVGPGTGVAAGQAVSLTATVPDPAWFVAGVTIKDTVTGAVVATPALTLSASGAQFSYTPAPASDVIVEVTYSKNPDAAKSTLTLDKTSTTVGTGITGTVTVLAADSTPLQGVPVTFSTASSATKIDGANSCLTNAQGQCSGQITSDAAGVYPKEFSARVSVSGTPTDVTGSPADVTFLPDLVDPDNCTFTITPEANLADDKTWVSVDSSDGYTGTLVARDSHNNLVTNLTAADIHFAASASYVLVSAPAPAGAGTWTATFTSKKVDATTTASLTVGGRTIGEALPIPFVAGPPVIGECTDPLDGSLKPGTHLVAAPTTLGAGGTSTATAYVTDRYCNPVEDEPVTFGLEPGSSAVLTVVNGTTDANGTAVATVADDAAEPVRVHATIMYQGQDTDIALSPVTVTFTEGGVDPTLSTFTVSPVPVLADDSTWVTADGVAAYTGTFTAMDRKRNLLSNLTPTDIVFAATGSVTVSTPVHNAGNGRYTVTFTSKVASADPLASLKYQNGPIGTALPIPFVAGPPVIGECTDPIDGSTKPGTHLEADPMSPAIGETADVTAYVTDANCNPVKGEPVTFSLGGQTQAALAVIQAVTDPAGKAYATVDDTTAEAVPVHATIMYQGRDTDIARSPLTITFKEGDVDFTLSTFTVSPAADLADKTTWVEDNGVAAYTGTFTAKDSRGNPLNQLVLGNIVFDKSSTAVTMTAVTRTGPGTYTVEYTSKVADATTTASLTYQNRPVGDLLPIPFKTGKAVPGECTDPYDGSRQPGTHLAAAPTNPTAGSTATATAYVTDFYCNPVEGEAVTFTIDPGTAAKLTVTRGITAADGTATATVSDTVAEPVKVHASILVDDVAAEISQSPVTITFVPGPLSTTRSLFTITPTANLTDKTTWVAADGRAAYTGTLTAKDAGGNLRTDVAVADITFAASSANVTVSSPVVNHHDGTYTVTFTTKVAAAAITATVKYAGQRVGGVLPIPFAAGPGVPGDCTDPVTGQQREGTFLAADPLRVQIPGPSHVTATVVDANCNPVPDEPVDFWLGDGSSALLVVQQGTTDAAGLALAQVSDATVEAVQVHAKIAAGEVYRSPVASKQPVTVAFVDDQVPPAPVIGSPATNTVTKAKPLVISGTGEAGKLLTVWVGESKVCGTTVGATGNWTCSKALLDGTYVLYATQRTATSDDSASSNSVRVTIDTQAPDKPDIKVANKTEISGTAEAGATITVTYPTKAGHGTATTKVGADGTWKVPTPADAQPGEITAVATDAAGNESEPAHKTLDPDLPNTPVIRTANIRVVAGYVPDTPNPLDPGTTVTITWPTADVTTGVVVAPDGSWTYPTPAGMVSGTVTVWATDPAGNESASVTKPLDTKAPTAPVVNPSNGSKVTGKGEPGTTVTIKDKDGKTVECAEGAVVVADDGTFTCTPVEPLEPGSTIRVTVTDPAGNESPETTITVSKLAITVSNPTPHPGDTETVTGYHFNAGERVCLTLTPDNVNFGCQTADGEGTVAFTVALAATSAVGTHQFTLKGDESGSVA